MWLVLVIVWLLIFAALQLIPVIGVLATYLIAPALTGALLVCARDALGGRAIDVGQLFDPLTADGTRGPMLILGALFLVAHIVLLLIGVALIIATLGMTMLEHHAVFTEPGGPGSGALEPDALLRMGLGAALVALILVALGLLIALFFYYAIPLVLFAGVQPTVAIGLGFKAIVRNWLPLLVLGVLWLVLAILASVPLLLGWLVLLPVTFGAWLASYRDVFPEGLKEAGTDTTVSRPPPMLPP